MLLGCFNLAHENQSAQSTSLEEVILDHLHYDTAIERAKQEQYYAVLHEIPCVEGVKTSFALRQRGHLRTAMKGETYKIT